MLIQSSTTSSPGLSTEDIDRARDRARVVAARSRGRRGTLIWLLLGPGMLAMLGENDGPSMLSYAASGATYGVGFFLPFILVTFAAAFVVQEMAMRLGAVTHRGYGELIMQRFGPFWGWLSVGDVVVTNIVTVVAEIVAIRVGMGFFGVRPSIAVALAIALLIFSAFGSRYARWERLVMGFATFNLIFIGTAFLAHPSPAALGRSFLTWTPWPKGSAQQFLLIAASNIGATVTPWMLFFQQSASVDKGLTPRDIAGGRVDTLVGTILAAVAGCAALVATVPLFTHHVTIPGGAQGGANYAEALLPFVGRFGATLFALGLVEAGAVAMLTISASTAYAVSETIGGAGHSFNHSILEAPTFHAVNVGVAVAAGLLVLVPGMPLLAVALNANLLATVLMAPALAFLLILAGDREIMGDFRNARWQTVLGIVIAALVAFAASASTIASFVEAFPGLVP